MLVLGATAATVAVRAVARQKRFMPLQGKVAIVTGGSRGLGLVLARQLVDDGARVAICARDPDELQRAERELRTRGLGGDVLAHACDVTSRPQVNELVRKVVERFGRVDVLINNAGTIQVGPVETMGVEDFDEAMALHFWAPLYMTLAVLPVMRGEGGGRIVNVASIGGKVPTPHLVPYAASKFALVGFSESLRAELMKDRVYVTTVNPGLMRTGSPRNATFKGRHREEYAWFKIGDSLPGTSMSADRAAAQILDAARHGDAEVILSVPAKLASTFHGLFPGLTSDLAGLVNRLLPAPGGIGPARVTGAQSESAITRSPLTRLTDDAARANNEVP
jgi:NAD(P)-dependent dehydrogenase (short-subunit alcohol dehydrogenase family)